jgi:hypothetical protein
VNVASARVNRLICHASRKRGAAEVRNEGASQIASLGGRRFKSCPRYSRKARSGGSSSFGVTSRRLRFAEGRS